MAARKEDLSLTINLKLFKDVSKLGKVKLKQICKNLICYGFLQPELNNKLNVVNF